ncbi:phage minor head protein, partial [Salmonella enterica]|uniref:phage minor head protein n=1 Tax=Salmonella enterica TaxID=28901 RepID=UPI0019F357EA
AIAVGSNPRDIESDIIKRVGVSESRAKNIAQTELTGILRKSQSDEVQESKIILGLNSALFWVSALLKTTRATHSARHARAFSPEEVEEFYSKDGNRYRCHCAQTPCMLDENGNVIMLESSLNKMVMAREKWKSQHEK